MKKILFIVMIFVGILICWLGVFKSYYEPAEFQFFYLVNGKSESVKKIAFIGDSWAAL